MGRKRVAGAQTSRKTKRQRTVVFGAPSGDDERLLSDAAPSSSAFSTRNIKAPLPPSLSSLCINVFSEHFDLLSDEDHWVMIKNWIVMLPEGLIPRVFEALKERHPGRLSHAVITAYFLRGASISLSPSLGVTGHTLAALPRTAGPRLRVLELSDFSKFSDKQYASTIKQLSGLETLILKNCVKVGPLTAEAIADTCSSLRKVNLNFTSVTAVSLLPLFLRCRELEVLKIAGVQNLSDATMSKLFSTISGDESSRNSPFLRRLTSLKLRHNTISEVALLPFLRQCPALSRLDMSFTLLKHFPTPKQQMLIEKLSLTSTFVPSKELITLITRLPHLKILNIGAMGLKPGTNLGVANTTAMTLNDDTLWALTDSLGICSNLTHVNLVQNSKLGLMDKSKRALRRFIQHIGRNVQYLNLSGVPVHSDDLEGLLADDSKKIIPPLRMLILNKTMIDDRCAPWITSCKLLELLDVAETRISAEGLFPIIDACSNLSQLNLTGCRGVKIADRRRFFEVWKEQRGISIGIK